MTNAQYEALTDMEGADIIIILPPLRFQVILDRHDPEQRRGQVVDSG